MFDKLSAPFTPDQIHWRAQTVTKDGSKALALAYIDARDVMDRLDSAAGPANWRDSYIETPKGRTICTLEIRVDGEWIAKSDGAGDTDVEGEKGSISDALKRSAVKWGIGRYLYDLGNVWAPCESYEVEDRGKKRWKWSKWAAGADREFANALARLSGQAPKPHPTTITDEQQEFLTNLCAQTGVNIGDFLLAGKCRDLRDVPASQFENAKAWINDRAKEKENA